MTFDGQLADVKDGTDLLVAENSVSQKDLIDHRMKNLQELSEGGRKSNEGGSSVKDDSSVVELSSGIAERNGIKVNLPVGLSSKRDLGHLPSVMIFVDATKHCFGLIPFTIGSVAQVKSEDGLVKHALIDHVVEWRNDLVHGN